MHFPETRCSRSCFGILRLDTFCIHRPDKIYHVTVMPCYDKKLEASRQDFYNDIYSTRDVDCVLTTGELETMMGERNWDLSIPVRAETERDSDLDMSTEIPDLIVHPGTSSGSYLHSLLSIYSTPTTELSTRALRSVDYEEFTLTDTSTGKVVFKGAKCYGFRNLQNLVRKVGREAGIQVGRGAAGKLRGGVAVRMKRTAKDNTDGAEVDKKYDYVEVMACPSGCVNGGGQLKPPSTASTYTTDIAEPNSSIPFDGSDIGPTNAKWGNKEWVKKVEQAYWHGLPTPPDSPGPVRAPELHLELSPNSPLPPPQLRSPFSSTHTDSLALRVLTDLCHPNSDNCSKPTSWTTLMDPAAETLRLKYFRTDYRAVESEVVGIQVKW